VGIDPPDCPPEMAGAREQPRQRTVPPGRLRAAAGNGLLTERDTTILTEVFALRQRLRLTHQVDQITAGLAPGDIVTMPELSPLNRSLLGDGVREIAAVQRRVGYLASDSGVPLRR
jgi:CBS domain-containing protein